MNRTGLLALALLLPIAGSCRRAPPRPNLVLITIDTLRADRLGCYGHDRPVTPELDRLAREGVRFPNAYATAPITAPSHASLLTGTYPLRHGVLTNGLYLLNGPEPTLAEILARKGYKTAAFVGAVPLDRRFGFNRGFTVYDDDFHASVLRGRDLSPWYQISLLSRERRADEVVQPALTWLEMNGREGPFFLWIHLFDPHSPYAPPNPWDTRFTTGNPGDPADKSLESLWAHPQSWHEWLRGITSAAHVRALYDGEIAYTDSQVGLVLAALGRLGRADDTVVIATADHGEGLGEHDEFFFHGDFVHETTLRVPLIIRAPWRLARGTVARVRARGIDVFPTALELLGVPLTTPIDGESLLGSLEREELRPVLAEAAYRDRSGRGQFAYIEGQLKVVVSDPLAGAPARMACYDLAADPRELDDVCRRRSDDFARLRARLEGLRRSLPRGGPLPTGAVPSEVMDALRSLGYTGQ